MFGFVVQPGSTAIDEAAFRFGGLALSVADHVPVTPIRTVEGAVFGALIGWPVDGETWMAGNGTMLVERLPADPTGFYRERLASLRGSWLAILAVGGQRQAWLDAMGSLSLVWDRDTGRAGGTAADLLPDAEYDARLDHPLRAALGVERDGWFPGGLTAHHGIERLLPGHVLDLDTGTARRHEHYETAVVDASSTGELLDKIAGEIRGLARGMAGSGRPLAMGLTGGGDSRMMLAALRGQTDGVVFYTLDGGPDRFDRVRADEIARIADIEWRALPVVEASADEQAGWDRRVGHCVATANRAMFPSVAPLARYANLGGVGGEAGRCFLWRSIESVPDRISAHDVIDRLKLPRVALLERRIGLWLDDLPVTDPMRILDLAFVEQRVGPWAFAQAWSNPFSLVLHPLANSAALRAMLSLPPDFRRGDGMVRGLIERNWPDLLAFPINRYGDWRDARRQVVRLARPDRAWRKLRQVVRSRIR